MFAKNLSFEFASEQFPLGDLGESGDVWRAVRVMRMTLPELLQASLEGHPYIEFSHEWLSPAVFTFKFLATAGGHLPLVNGGQSVVAVNAAVFPQGMLFGSHGSLIFLSLAVTFSTLAKYTFTLWILW